MTKVFLIDSAEIENVAKILPAKISMLKGTMQLHQVTTSQNGESNIMITEILDVFAVTREVSEEKETQCVRRDAAEIHPLFIPFCTEIAFCDVQFT